MSNISQHKSFICEVPIAKIHIYFHNLRNELLFTYFHTHSLTCSQEPHPVPEHALSGVTKAVAFMSKPVTLFRPLTIAPVPAAESVMWKTTNPQ